MTAVALADSATAIGAVSRLLRDQLHTRLTTVLADVTVGKPEPPTGGVTNPRLNLFLYELAFDPTLRNQALDSAQPFPLWLVLKYLITAFDRDGDSDTNGAHELLGQGLRTLQELSYLPLSGTAADVKALNDNPEVLKITFDDASAELLSKLMQGSDEKYRFSAGFQVRPVMIASAEPPTSSLLVGVDYESNTIIGDKGIGLSVFPFGGPEIAALSPAKFEPGSLLTMTGSGLSLQDLAVTIGPVEIPAVAQAETTLTAQVNGVVAGGAVMSAGSHPVSVVQTLRTGRRRQSNLLIGDLLPVLNAATPGVFNKRVPADPDSDVTGDITLTGVLMGTARDEVYVALYQNGRTVQLHDTFVFAPPPATPQSSMTLHVAAIPPGTYRVILRVNGAQAKSSPQVTLS